MPIATDAHLAVIDDDSKATRNDRIAAVWAHAHDLAMERHGEDKGPGFFTPPVGNKLMAALQAMPPETRAAAMLEAVEKHLAPAAPPPKPAHQPLPPVVPFDEVVPAHE